MILQRIGNAVKEQDWFVVLIEILIVIFGVFIGLQVDDWNNERLERVDEREILERLFAEAENAVAHISGFVENRAERNRQLENMVAFVSDPAEFPMDEGEATVALTRMTHFPSLKPPRTVLDELTASGQLQLIRSQKIRDVLGGYGAALSWHDGQLENFRNISGLIFDASLPYLEAQYAPDGPTIRDITVDWQSLRADKSFNYILLSSMRNQYTFQSYRQGVLEDAQRMCEVLADEIGRECMPKNKDEELAEDSQ